MSLRDEGFRYVLMDGLFAWRHPALLADVEYVDCTDMGDEEFLKVVERVSLENASKRP